MVEKGEERGKQEKVKEKRKSEDLACCSLTSFPTLSQAVKGGGRERGEKRAKEEQRACT